MTEYSYDVASFFLITGSASSRVFVKTLSDYSSATKLYRSELKKAKEKLLIYEVDIWFVYMTKSHLNDKREDGEFYKIDTTPINYEGNI